MIFRNTPSNIPHIHEIILSTRFYRKVGEMKSSLKPWQARTLHLNFTLAQKSAQQTLQDSQVSLFSLFFFLIYDDDMPSLMVFFLDCLETSFSFCQRHCGKCAIRLLVFSAQSTAWGYIRAGAIRSFSHALLFIWNTANWDLICMLYLASNFTDARFSLKHLNSSFSKFWYKSSVKPS